MNSRKIIGFGLIVFSAAALVIYLLFQTEIIQLLETFVSSDGEIRPAGVLQLNNLVFLASGLFAILGAVLVKSEDADWRRRMRRTFLRDPFCGEEKSWFTPKVVLIASSLVGLFLIFHIRLYDPDSQLFAILYLEDGLFESLTPILMIVCVVMLALSIPKLRNDPELRNYKNVISIVYVFLILIFFVNAMEEISWGQRIFGWETPQSFEGNVQDETNLHNFFNNYYLLFYRLLVFFPIVLLISIWMEMKQRFLIFKQTILPHPSLLVLSLLIALVSFVWFEEQELLEELFAVFFAFFSVRIYLCFRARERMEANLDKLRSEDLSSKLDSREAAPP